MDGTKIAPTYKKLQQKEIIIKKIMARRGIKCVNFTMSNRCNWFCVHYEVDKVISMASWISVPPLSHLYLTQTSWRRWNGSRWEIEGLCIYFLLNFLPLPSSYYGHIKINFRGYSRFILPRILKQVGGDGMGVDGK